MSEQQPGKPAAAAERARISPRREALESMLVPVLAIFTALAVSAVLILASDVKVLTAYSHILQDPGAALSATWKAVADAYGALFLGAIGNPSDMANAIGTTHFNRASARSRYSYWPDQASP